MSLRSPFPEERRRLWPNHVENVAKPFATKHDPCLVFLVQIISATNAVVGWHVSADLASLDIALPAIQVFELGSSSLVR